MPVSRRPTDSTPRCSWPSFGNMQPVADGKSSVSTLTKALLVPVSGDPNWIGSG
jgi:hypothetical protein